MIARFASHFLVEDEDALALVFSLHRHVKPPGEDLGSQGVIPRRLHIAGARGLEVGLIGNCGEQPCVAALVSSTIHLVAWHVGMGRVFF